MKYQTPNPYPIGTPTTHGTIIRYTVCLKHHTVIYEVETPNGTYVYLHTEITPIQIFMYK